MKEKLAMEVVSAEANKEMLEAVPHQNIEDMAVVYRFVLNSDDDGRAFILVTGTLIQSRCASRVTQPYTRREGTIGETIAGRGGEISTGMAPRERRGGHACKIAKWKTGGIFTF